MKIILVLSGEIASGKGTVAEYIVKKYNGASYRFSDSLQDILKRMHQEINRENYHRISMALRSHFSQNILSEIILNDIKKEKKEIIVLDGARRMTDIKLLKELEGFKLIFIDANLEKRYDRLKKREEKKDDREKRLKIFKKEHKSEVESKIGKMKKAADFVVDNNGNFPCLYRQIDQIIEKFANKSKEKRAFERKR